jgi:hypothetical protein
MLGNGYVLSRFMGRDFQLSQRHTIRYQNYQQKEKWFYLTPNQNTLNSSLFFIVIGMLLTLIYMFTDFVRIYSVILLPLVFITSFFYVNEKQIEKTQFPLQKFDRYYQDIHTLIEEKTSMLQSIQDLNGKLESQEETFQKMIQTLNTIINQKLNPIWFKEFTDPIHSTLDTYKNDLLKYDNSITSKFNDLLVGYLKHLKMTSVLSVPSLISFSVSDLQLKIETTKTQLENKLFTESESWIKQSKLNSPNACIELIQYLDSLRTKPEHHISLSFEFFNQTDKPQLWIDFLVNQKWLTGDFLLKSNYLDLYSWVFQDSIYKLIPKDQALDILKYIVEKDLYSSVLTMMLRLPSDYQSLPERFIRFNTIDNRSFQVAQVFATLYSQVVHFSDPSTLLMNQTYALENFYTESKTNTPSVLQPLFSSKNYLDFSDSIRNFYKQSYDLLNTVKINVLELVLWFKGNLKNEDSLFKFDASLSYLNDLQKTLSINKMHHFIFAIALVVYYQRPVLTQDPTFEKFITPSLSYFNVSVNTKKVDAIIPAIKKFYTKNGMRQELSSVLYHIEKDRLLLKKVLDNHHA